METPSKKIDFSSMMLNRVRRILLVSSPYDLFILQEDGQLQEQLNQDYIELSLTNPPQITHSHNAQQALGLIETQEHFDLIITLHNIGEMSVFSFARQAKELSPATPIVLLSSLAQEVHRQIESQDIHRSIDYLFAWQGNPDLLLAIVKMVEDNANAQRDMLECGVQGILLVEDSVKFYSAYLTDLYNIVLRQSNTYSLESFNTREIKQRKRSRPKVLFAQTYTHAKRLYDTYKGNLLGVISDVTFKYDSSDTDTLHSAGIDLCRFVQSDNPRMPLLLQSSESAMARVAGEMGIDFIDKNSKTIQEQMEKFINRRMAFGALSFIDPISGEIVGQAMNLAQLQEALEKVPPRVLEYYSKENMFSKWLNARGLFDFANKVKAIDFDHFETVEQLRSYLIANIEQHRRESCQGVIAEFDPNQYSRYITFVRSGSGSLGGKARGLAFINSLLEQHRLHHRWENMLVTIPRTFVAASEHFDNFMNNNQLHYIIEEDLDDNEVLSEFMSSRLDDTLTQNLAIFLEQIHRPIAVRSSSLLEDSHYQPFAGIYSTHMVPYVANKQKMLRLTIKAIKSVYASIYYRASRSYIEATGNILSEEKMAIVIQELCGSSVGDIYYPTISGNARSVNFYPVGDEQVEQGVCQVAMGLGRAVMDGGQSLRFSPAHPKRALTLSSPEIALRDSQKYIYALELDPKKMKTSTDESVNLRKVDLYELQDSPHLKFVCSTWNRQDGRMSESPFAKGNKVVTFAPILKYDKIPLAEILSYLLKMGKEAFHSDVEIEFAVNMDVEQGKEYNFNLLQIRPIISTKSNQRIDWKQIDTTGAILRASRALGRGEIEGITDVVYIVPELFDSAKTQEMATEIARINETLGQSGRSYMLIGPGRWGSSDRWLGIPVKWADISHAKVIVECGTKDFQVDPSQGTHFFQNITSLGVGYITMNPDLEDGEVDFERLGAMESLIESDYLRHVRFDNQLQVLVDGAESQALIKPPLE